MWIEQAKIQRGNDGSPEMVGGGRFRQVDLQSDIVLAQWGTGRWGFQFLDGKHVLADFATEQAARDALVEALPVYTFTEQAAGQDTESTPDDEPTRDAEPATGQATSRKRTGSR